MHIFISEKGINLSYDFSSENFILEGSKAIFSGFFLSNRNIMRQLLDRQFRGLSILLLPAFSTIICRKEGCQEREKKLFFYYLLLKQDAPFLLCFFSESSEN